MFGHTDIVTAAEQFRIFAATRVDDGGVRGALLAGSQDFARGLAPQIEPHQQEQDFIYAQRFAPRPPLGDLLPPGALGPELHAAARMAFLSHAYTLREIGDALGRPSSTIWSWVQRAQHELSVAEPLTADAL